MLGIICITCHTAHDCTFQRLSTSSNSMFWTEEMRRRKSGSLINLSTWNHEHVLNTERWNGDKQVVANVWTGQSPSASSLTCDSQASDQKRQKSISQMDTAGLSRASLSLIFLGLHKPILRVSRGNDMKSTPWEMAFINRLVSTVDSTH